MLKAAAGTAIMIAIFATAGCGDGGGQEATAPPVQKSDFLKQVDQLCVADQRRTDQAGPKFDSAVRSGRLDVAANLVLKLQAAEAKTIRRIEAIVPPEADATGIAAYLRLSRRLNELDSRIAGAVRVENLAVFRDASKEAETLESRRSELAGKIGLDACRSD